MNEKEALEDFIKKTVGGISLLTERMKLVEDEILKLNKDADTCAEVIKLMTARIDVLSKRLEIVEEQIDQKEQFFTGGGG